MSQALPAAQSIPVPQGVSRLIPAPALPSTEDDSVEKEAPRLRVLPTPPEVQPLPVEEVVPDSSRSLFEEAAQLEGHHFDYYHRSFSSTLASSVMMLSGVQCVRALSRGEFLTPSFLITVPLDVALTLTSHAIALNHIPFLKRIFDGDVFDKKFEAPTRIGANVLMGVSYIYASWGMADVNFTLEKCLMALGLCAVVYPTLYVLKRGIFKKIPLNRDLKRLKKFRSNPHFGEAFQKLESEILSQAAANNIPEEERESLLLTALENLVLERPYEDDVRGLPSLSERKDIQAAIRKADRAVLKPHKEKARIGLIEKLLKVASQRGPGNQAAKDARRVLNLGEPLTQKGSLNLMKSMVKRYRAHRRWVWIGSLVDQSVSVGIAGGIGLYEVNKFALSD
jgi:hypothetical protein